MYLFLLLLLYIDCLVKNEKSNLRYYQYWVKKKKNINEEMYSGNGGDSGRWLAPYSAHAKRC